MLHLLDERVHLRQCGTVWHRSGDGQNQLFVTGEVTALIHFVGKKPQRATQYFVDNGFDFFLIRGVVENSVVLFCEFRFFFNLVGNQEDRQSESQYDGSERNPFAT